MPPLTTTSHKPSFSRPPPNAATFTFAPLPTPSSPQIGKTLVTFPAGSTLTTDRHWHNTHIEYIHVTQGAALVTLHNTSRIYTAADGAVMVPLKARHEWMRWDCPGRKGEQKRCQEEYIAQLSAEGEKGEAKLEKLQSDDLEAEEWTSPADANKEIFFRNLFSGFQEPRAQSGRFGPWITIIQVFMVMWALDNPLVLVDLGGAEYGTRWQWVAAKIENLVAFVVMGGASVVGQWLELKPVNREYTPVWLMEKWEAREEKRRKYGRKDL